MVNFSELVKQRNEINAQILANLDQAWNETVQKAFDENPLIGGIFWIQYTPGFNDGDPCYSHIGEPGTWLTEEEDDEDFDSSDLDDERTAPDLWAKDNGVNVKGDEPVSDNPENLAKYLELKRQDDEVIGAVFGFEDFFLNLFDDDQKIFVSRNEDGSIKVDQESYECGY